jgi:dienelactone hydrolase
LALVLALGAWLGAYPVLAHAQSTPPWEKLQAAYKEGATPPQVTETEDKPGEADAIPNVRRLRLQFALGDNPKEKVPGLFLLPTGDGPFPVVVLLHGIGSGKEAMMRYFGREFARRGFACLALDAPGQGERHTASTPAMSGTVWAQTVQNGVREYRYALTYLQGRKDVAPGQIGLLGYSMGGIQGTILAGVDNRVQAAALLVASDPVTSALANLPEAERSTVALAAPSLFVRGIAPRPVLFVNAKSDRIATKEEAERLHNAAGKNKTVLWVAGGHVLAPDDAQKAIEWLAGKIKTTPLIKPTDTVFKP